MVELHDTQQQPHIERELRAALAEVASRADIAHLDRDATFDAELAIGSTAFLSFVAAIRRHFAIDIPEVDFAQLSSLRRAAEYLEHRGIH